jgi:drug/metabolite transporter (DMT)-like permease
MPLSENLLGVFFALTSAAAWGGGDFSGGIATRRHGPIQVLVLSSLCGMVLLSALALVWREAPPSAQSVMWAVLAGAVGTVGIATLYRALSTEPMASVAPVAAVIGVALPVAYGIGLEGMPRFIRLAGFALAFLGIWLVSRTSTSSRSISRRGFLLTCLAGICIGGFLIAMARIETGQVLLPLVIARLVSFCIACLLIRTQRLSFPPLVSNPLALLAGVLDSTGNLFYLLATQFTRLDIAAVLSSLYPAATVLLAYLLLKERLSSNQQVGVAMCLLAIVLITL